MERPKKYKGMTPEERKEYNMIKQRESREKKKELGIPKNMPLKFQNLTEEEKEEMKRKKREKQKEYYNPEKQKQNYNPEKQKEYIIKNKKRKIERFLQQELGQLPLPEPLQEQQQLPLFDFNPPNLLNNLSGFDESLFPDFDFDFEGSGMFDRQIQSLQRKLKGGMEEGEYTETIDPRQRRSKRDALPPLPVPANANPDWDDYVEFSGREEEEPIYESIDEDDEEEDERARKMIEAIRFMDERRRATTTDPSIPTAPFEESRIRRHIRPNEATAIALEERDTKKRDKMDREEAELERRKIERMRRGDRERRDAEDAEILRRNLGDKASADFGRLKAKYLGPKESKYIPDVIGRNEGRFIPEGSGMYGGKKELKREPLRDQRGIPYDIEPVSREEQMRQSRRRLRERIHNLNSEVDIYVNTDYRDFTPYDLHIFQVEVENLREEIIDVVGDDNEEVDISGLNYILNDINDRIQHRQGPRGHLPYVEGSGIFSSVKELGSKVINKGKDLYNKAKDIVSSASKLNNTSRKTLEKFGKQKIKNIIATREVVQKSVTTLINLISAGQLDKEKKKMGYDDFFHIRLYCEMENGAYILLEKNEVVYIYPKTQIKGEKLPINYNSSSLTLNELVEKTIKYMGEKDFYTYDAFTNNCASFVIAILKANGLWSEKDKSFLLQDVQYLKDKLPKTKQVASFITQLGAVVSRARGKGMKTKYGGMENEVLPPFAPPMNMNEEEEEEEEDDFFDGEPDEEGYDSEESDDEDTQYHNLINDYAVEFGYDDEEEAQESIQELYDISDPEWNEMPTQDVIKIIKKLLKHKSVVTTLLANQHMSNPLPHNVMKDIIDQFR